MRCRSAPSTWFAAAIAIGLIGCGVRPGGAAEWHTGTKLSRQLAGRVDSLAWEGAPLRDLLASLAEARHTAVFLDRRIDPGQKPSLRIRNQT